jgi:tetratricopeptide (TPR) repeat protein
MLPLPTKTDADELIARGRDLISAGDLPQATDLLNQAVQIYWAIGDYYAAAAQTGNYGWQLRRIGRADLARPYLERAAEIFDQIGLTEFAERHRFAADDLAADLTPELLASLPPAIRGALERGDGTALQFAIDALPVAEQALVIERLTAAGVISDVAAQTPDDTLRQFEPLLQGIARVAQGDLRERAEIEIALNDLDQKGWRISKAVRKIWNGERKDGPLTYGLDDLDAALVRRILTIIGTSVN